MPEVITLGECMALLYPADPVELDFATTLKLDIAGAESNLAIGLSRLGHGVRFVSRVGADPFGRRIRALLATERVDTTGMIEDNQAPTGVFFREWLPDGARRRGAGIVRPELPAAAVGCRVCAGRAAAADRAGRHCAES